ncbi:MAG: hypothetical protein JRE63_12765 [Deltaproteobacteria bacterium]|jgi:hypothetical protein|nr:hypothetical protein [Deltaproteobacteria bacterium]MBW2520321.1 hypothetical protein [Deltaproteobacteria bacterium]
MAFRALIIGSFLLVICHGWACPAAACFGPKLYVGVSTGVESAVLYDLVTLYVKEKTGVESIRVLLATTQDPVREIHEERLDLVFANQRPLDEPLFIAFPSYPILLAGQRPKSDLQFTTVLPAIRKLGRLLHKDDLDFLVSQVRAGEGSMKAVRHFLMDRRWI